MTRLVGTGRLELSGQRFSNRSQLQIGEVTAELLIDRILVHHASCLRSMNR